jgi:hypothetical protein
MIKSSRYILILLTVIALSAFLPDLFRTTFEKHVPVPFVMYSSVTHQFVMRKATGGKTLYYDSEGNQFTRKRYEQQLPLFHFRQLMTDGLMPDSLFGKPVDVFEINNANFFSRITPSDIDSPQPGLYPLFESESGRVTLENPGDYFRITRKGIQFIDPASNGIKPGKSMLFTKVMTEKGMAFPAKMIAGIPTIRKKYDQGYFIVDKNNHLFHLKMEKGLPYVVQIRLPGHFHIRHIECTDFNNREFYGYIITNDNRVFVLETDTYQLIPWPVKHYNSKTDKLSLRGNLDSRLAIIDKPDEVYAYASNRKYVLQNEYHERLNPHFSRGAHFTEQLLFPFRLVSGPPTSGFHRIVFQLPADLLFMAGNLFFLLLYLAIFFRRKNVKYIVPDLLIILVTGVYGFLGVLLLSPAQK